MITSNRYLIINLLILALFCTSCNLAAQQSSKDLLQQYIDEVLTQPLINSFSTNQTIIQPTNNNYSATQVATVPEVFCYESMGFFCKLEHKAMQRGNFPLRFRLGEFWSTVEAEYGEWSTF